MKKHIPFWEAFYYGNKINREGFEKLKTHKLKID